MDGFWVVFELCKSSLLYNNISLLLSFASSELVESRLIKRKLRIYILFDVQSQIQHVYYVSTYDIL